MADIVKKGSTDIREDADAVAIAAISTALGVPIPPTIAMNMMKTTSFLVTDTIDVARAWLQSKAKVIRAKGDAEAKQIIADADAEAKVTKGSAAIALEAISDDPEMAKRAALNLGRRILREQTNREAVVEGAVNELRAKPSTVESDAPREIDEDWLDQFGRLASTKSNDDMRAYFSRVLAGEIRSPGTFAPSTLEVLTRLTPHIAKLYQRLCAITVQVDTSEPASLPPELVAHFAPFVLTAPYGAPGSNKLMPLGFSYSTLCELQDAGLIQQDLSSWREFTAPLFVHVGVTVAGKRLSFTMADPAKQMGTEQRRGTVINFTRAGRELRRIAHVEPNAGYMEKVSEWVCQTFALARTPESPTS